jgi:hypothetical protein
VAVQSAPPESAGRGKGSDACGGVCGQGGRETLGRFGDDFLKSLKTFYCPEKEQSQLIKQSWPKFVKANTAIFGR